MYMRTRVSKLKEQDVDDAYKKLCQSRKKFHEILRNLSDLSDEIDDCDRDADLYRSQLYTRLYESTGDKARLEDGYSEIRRHKSNLREQYDRAHERLDSVKANLDKHRQEYKELNNTFEDEQQDTRIAAASKKLQDEERERRRGSEAKEDGHRPSFHYAAEATYDRSRPRRPDPSRRSSRTHDQHQRPPSQGSQHPPRSRDGPIRPPLQKRMPTEQTITSWRRYVDDCFKDYAAIKEFPHPPVFGKHDDFASWEKDLKALFRNLDGIDMKKESYRWHPDKFSPCESSKKEKFQEYASAVFVVLNAMAKEK